MLVCFYRERNNLHIEFISLNIADKKRAPDWMPFFYFDVIRLINTNSRLSFHITILNDDGVNSFRQSCQRKRK